MAVDTVPAGSKPSVVVSVRISMSERHGFSAAAPLTTRASFLGQGRARGWWNHHRNWSDTSDRD